MLAVVAVLAVVVITAMGSMHQKSATVTSTIMPSVGAICFRVVFGLATGLQQRAQRHVAHA